MTLLPMWCLVSWTLYDLAPSSPGVLLLPSSTVGERKIGSVAYLTIPDNAAIMLVLWPLGNVCHNCMNASVASASRRRRHHFKISRCRFQRNKYCGRLLSLLRHTLLELEIGWKTSDSATVKGVKEHPGHAR